MLWYVLGAGPFGDHVTLCHQLTSGAVHLMGICPPWEM